MGSGRRNRAAGSRSAERQRALLDAARLITASARDLDAVLDALSEQARHLLRADAAAIDLLDAPDELVVRRGTRLVNPASPLGMPGFRYRPGGLTRETFATNRPAFARDYHADPRPDPAYKAERAAVASLLIVPLAGEEDAMGILSVEWARMVDLGREDVELASALGAQAAAAIRTARLHAALRSGEKWYRLVPAAAPVAVWEWDLVSDTVVWSGAGRALLGYESDERPVPAAWWHERVHPDERDPAIARAAAALASGADHLVNELRVRRADGAYARILVTLLRLFRDQAGTAVRALGVIQDVTAVRVAEAEHDRLTHALARAAERERVAMDLHDGVLASMSGVSYLLGAVARSATASREELLDAVETAARRVTTIADELRRYAAGLRAPGPDPVQIGLNEVAEAARAAGVAAYIEAPDLPTGLEADVLADVLHVAREAVANALRHAAATQLTIRLVAEADRLILQVADDGVGFDAAALGDRRGHGLGNMAARARRLGAELAVTSSPGAGTDVRLTLPLGTTATP
jgi:PAS domain S-box-containing protein